MTVVCTPDAECRQIVPFLHHFPSLPPSCFLSFPPSPSPSIPHSLAPFLFNFLLPSPYKPMAMYPNAFLEITSLLLNICPQDLFHDSTWKFVILALLLFSGYTLLVSLSSFPNTDHRFHSPCGIQTSLCQLSRSHLPPPPISRTSQHSMEELKEYVLMSTFFITL